MRIDAYNAVSHIYQANITAKGNGTAVKSSKNDEYEISDTAKLYQTAKSAVFSASDIRLDKVRDIKARIAAGTYNISSEAIAERMLSNVSTLTF